MSSDVISVRVRRDVKEEAFRLGIDMRKIVEEALEEAVKEQREKRIRRVIGNIKQGMEGVSERQWVRVVRESRKKRAPENT